MPLIRIQGPTDPHVAEYRDLADAELIRARGLFVAEGRLVVRRVIEDRFVLQSLLLNEASHLALADTLQMVSGEVPIYCAIRTILPASPATTSIAAASHWSSDPHPWRSARFCAAPKRSCFSKR